MEDIEIPEEPPAKRKRQPRTNSRQHEAYVAFLEGNQTPLDPLHINYRSSWEELKNILNKKGTERSTKQWINNLKSWEYQLKSKKRAEITHADGTMMGELENRAIRVFGRVAVFGDDSVETFGLPNTSTELSPNSSLPNDFASTTTSTATAGLSSGNTGSKSGTNKKNSLYATIDRLGEKLEKHLEAQEKQDEQMQQALNLMAKSLDKLGSAMMMLAEKNNK